MLEVNNQYKYKDELSINGDLSYLNLDWTPVPIIPKFVDIVVNGIAERTYDIKAYSQDPHGIAKRTEYMESIMRDMQTREFNDTAMQTMNMNLYENDKETLPESQEELDIHMQLSYKQAVELAEEQALKVLMEGSKYELIKKRFYHDLTVLGIGAAKTNFTTSEGVTIEYVDPADLVYSYTDSPYFDDIYYVGEVKNIPINELVKQFPQIDQAQAEEILANNSKKSPKHATSKELDGNQVQVLYFEYKTFMNETYKVKETGTGADKAIEKDDSFNPPEDMEGNFVKLQRTVEVLYEGAYVLGAQKLFEVGNV